MPSRLEIVAAARTWLGTPWRHQGRLKGVGVDCIGLVAGVARELGYAAPDRADYPRRPSSEELMQILGSLMDPGAAGVTGDLVLWRIDGQPQHVGILTGPSAAAGGVIHAYALRPIGRVVEHDMHAGWPGPVQGFYGFPGVTD